MTGQHVVYVIYYDGKPIDAAGGRVAYWSEGTAKAEVTRRLGGKTWCKDAERAANLSRYEIVPYGRVAE